jgi:protein subunit release factor B
MSAFPPEYVRAHLVALGCDVKRVEETFIHSGGHGGQNVNKVATCAAWKLLAEQLQRMRNAADLARRAARELKRRQNAQRPRGVKKQFVELKRRRAKTRQARHDMGQDD